MGKEDVNQYGRRTWDVEEYAQRRNGREKRSKQAQYQGSLEKEHILRQITGPDSDSRFGEENSWLVCRICKRRFKDSLKLSEHLSSKMHLDRVRELEAQRGGKGGPGVEGAEEKDITLENVKRHLEKLKSRMGN